MSGITLSKRDSLFINKFYAFKPLSSCLQLKQEKSSNVATSQLKQEKSGSLTSSYCSSRPSQPISKMSRASMSQATHVWTDAEECFLLGCYRDRVMKDLFWHCKASFHEEVAKRLNQRAKDSLSDESQANLNGKRKSNVKPYVQLDKDKVGRKSEKLLEQIRLYYAKHPNTVCTPLLLILCLTPALFILFVNLMKLCIPDCRSPSQ